jgi:hypothetical protein
LPDFLSVKLPGNGAKGKRKIEKAPDFAPIRNQLRESAARTGSSATFHRKFSERRQFGATRSK